MNRFKAVFLTLAFIANGLPSLVFADHNGAGGGHAGGGHPAGALSPRSAGGGVPSRGGGGSRYDGGGGVGVGLGIGLFSGILLGAEIAPAYPYYYPLEVQPPVVYRQPLFQVPPQNLSLQPANASPGTWYFCETSQSFFPYVGTCSVPWRMVPALPPAPAPTIAIPQ